MSPLIQSANMSLGKANNNNWTLYIIGSSIIDATVECWFEKYCSIASIGPFEYSEYFLCTNSCCGGRMAIIVESEEGKTSRKS